MSRSVRIAAGVGVVLLVARLFAPGPDRAVSPTSYGSIPHGFGALHDLLTERGASPGRSLEAIERLPAGATQWWIEPTGVCDGPHRALWGDGGDGEDATWPARRWIEAGATAVVFLLSPDDAEARAGARRSADRGGGDRADDPGEGASRPRGDASPSRDPSDDSLERDHADDSPRAEPADAAPPNEDDPADEADGRVCTSLAGFELPEREEFAASRATGPLVPRARSLGVERLWLFREALDWRVVLDVDDRPLALERKLGEGRLVVLSEARFLRNAHLDAADAAVLAVDLVDAYGPARIDERAHGFVLEANAARYVAASPAAPVFLGLLCVGLAVLWRGAAWPRRHLDDHALPAPTLSVFVASLADLYARSRDSARLGERYREVSVARLRRHFGAGSELSVTALAERLVRDGRANQAELAPLLDATPVESTAQLRRRARELDRLVQEVTR